MYTITILWYFEITILDWLSGSSNWLMNLKILRRSFRISWKYYRELILNTQNWSTKIITLKLSCGSMRNHIATSVTRSVLWSEYIRVESIYSILGPWYKNLKALASFEANSHKVHLKYSRLIYYYRLYISDTWLSTYADCQVLLFRIENHFRVFLSSVYLPKIILETFPSRFEAFLNVS